MEHISQLLPNSVDDAVELRIEEDVPEPSHRKEADEQEFDHKSDMRIKGEDLSIPSPILPPIDGGTFDAIEEFSLDENFDYDNVELASPTWTAEENQVLELLRSKQNAPMEG